MGGLAGAGLSALPAEAAPGQTAHGISMSLDFSSNPNTTLEPPQPPFAPLAFPANCPIDANAVFTITGNAVQHGVTNKNGGWFGETIEGSAILADGNASYTGHFTGWTGFGTNQNSQDATGQLETGLTADFHGVSTTGQTVSVHVAWHGTENNNGNITVLDESLACS
jgi:hypothetical protein